MMSETLIIWAVVMLGAMAQGLTGLGFALVSVPVLMMFDDARSVIVTTLILTSVLNALILFQARGHISLKDAGPVLLGSLAGVPVGSYLLVVLSPAVLKPLVAVLVILISIPLLLGYTRSCSHPRTVSLITGAISGALQGSTSMGSAPVALLMANQGIPKEDFRGILVLRSMAASTLSVVTLVPSGLIDARVAGHALLLAPALLAGFAAGTLLMKLVPQRLFKRLTLLLIAGAALASLASSLL